MQFPLPFHHLLLRSKTTFLRSRMKRLFGNIGKGQLLP
jgi:hypothetical protein